MIVGGGPAGSTSAALLAKENIDVLLLEKDHFPRYHIGESLLASCLPVLRLSGAYEAVEKQGFQIKRGAYFWWKDDTWILDWSKIVGSDDAWSWQVDRGTFDHILLRNAAKQGATVVEGGQVKEIGLDSSGRPKTVYWECPHGKNHETTFDFIIDASGRAGVLGHRTLGLRQENPEFRNTAIWSYWENVKLNPASPEGAINVISNQDGGWFWLIPLTGGRFSIGAVISNDHYNAKRKIHDSLDDTYLHLIEANESLGVCLQEAAMITEASAERDYSYFSKRLSGPGYLLIGDAACFLDPLLSTGIHLAMQSALTASSVLASIIRNEISEEKGQEFFNYTYARAYSRFLVLVSRMYKRYSGTDEYFSHAHNMCLNPADRNMTLQESFTSIVAGLTDTHEGSTADQRARTNALATEVKELFDLENPIDGMSFVWDLWRDPTGLDNSMGDLRIKTDPLGIGHS